MSGKSFYKIKIQTSKAKIRIKIHKWNTRSKLATVKNSITNIYMKL